MGSKFCQVKNLRNFSDKLSQMTSDDAFWKNLIFANDFLSGKY